MNGTFSIRSLWNGNYSPSEYYLIFGALLTSFLITLGIPVMIMVVGMFIELSGTTSIDRETFAISAYITTTIAWLVLLGVGTWRSVVKHTKS